jgi:hypothetical protein
MIRPKYWALMTLNTLQGVALDVKLRVQMARARRSHRT